MTTPEIREIFDLPDRKSIAPNLQVLDGLLGGACKLIDLSPLFRDGNPLIQLRALDVAERFSRENPAAIQDFRQEFLIEIDEEMLWEGRLSVTRILALADWDDSEKEGVLKCLRQTLDDPQPFVSAWSLDTLSILSLKWPELREEVVERVLRFFESGTAAQKARCRHIAKRIGLQAPPRG